jgi:hypothetical protein
MEICHNITTKEISKMMHVVVLFAIMLLFMTPLFHSIAKLK